MPKFSIIVPVYQAERYLERCIRSALEQSYSDFELLLLDDGSADSSGTICDVFEKKDPRVRVFHKENTGPLQTRCHGVEQAKGDVILFLDADDCLEKIALERIDGVMEESGCDLIIFGAKRILNEKVMDTFADEKYLILEDKRELYRKCLLSRDYNPIWRKAAKKELYKGEDLSEYYHVFRAEDQLQSLQLLRACHKALFLPDLLYRYYQHSGSITHADFYRGYRCDCTVQAAVRDFLKKEAVFSKEDWNDLRGFDGFLLINDLSKAGRARIPRKEKMAMAESFYENVYYQSMLKNQSYTPSFLGRKKWIYRLFRSGHLGVLVFVLSVYGFIFPIKEIH